MISSNIGFGLLGNGITVYDRGQIVNNDYKTIAHIGESIPAKITYYDKKTPLHIRLLIQEEASNFEKREET